MARLTTTLDWLLLTSRREKKRKNTGDPKIIHNPGASMYGRNQKKKEKKERKSGIGRISRTKRDRTKGGENVMDDCKS